MILGLFECRAGDFVLGREPIEPSHRALPSVEGQEWYRETPDMAQQQPRSLKYCVAIRDPSRQDRAVEQPSTGKFLKFSAPLPKEMKAAMPGVKI